MREDQSFGSANDPRPDDDAWLREALHDVADDVTPHDRLTQIQARTRTSSRRTGWTWGAGWNWGPGLLASGAVVASVVLAVSVLPSLVGGNERDGNPAATGTGTTAATAVDSHLLEQEAKVADPAVPVYYAVSTASWDHAAGSAIPLAREFHRDESSDRMQAALREVSRPPQDSDYLTYVPDGMVLDAQVRADELVIEASSDDWSQRPAELSDDQAHAAVLQLVYTTRAAAGQSRLGIRVEADGAALDTLLGVDVQAAAAVADREALVPLNLTAPRPGVQVGSKKLRVEGRGIGLDRGWTWSITDSTGTTVRKGHGAPVPGGGLQAFSTTLRLTGLTPGHYSLRVQVKEPPQATNPTGAPATPSGNRPWAETRDFVIR